MICAGRVCGGVRGSRAALGGLGKGGVLLVGARGAGCGIYTPCRLIGDSPLRILRFWLRLGFWVGLWRRRGGGIAGILLCVELGGWIRCVLGGGGGGAVYFCAGDEEVVGLVCGLRGSLLLRGLGGGLLLRFGLGCRRRIELRGGEMVEKTLLIDRVIELTTLTGFFLEKITVIAYNYLGSWIVFWWWML